MDTTKIEIKTFFYLIRQGLRHRSFESSSRDRIGQRKLAQKHVVWSVRAGAGKDQRETADQRDKRHEPRDDLIVPESWTRHRQLEEAGDRDDDQEDTKQETKPIPFVI